MKIRILLILQSLLLTLTFTLEVKDTTDTLKSASYLDLHLQIDNREILKPKLYHNRDGFTFPIVSFPFISRNIPPVPAYGVYISQLICYSRACAQYSDFLDRAQLLTQKLLKQCYFAPKLKSSIQKFFGVERQVSYNKQDLLTLLEHLSSPLFFVWLGLCCSSFLFVLSYYVSLCSEFRVVTSVTISA